jgi:hypothetical protein
LRDVVVTADYETVPNKLWLLTATGHAGLGTILGRVINARGTHDEFDGFVVRAPDEPAARLLAAQWGGDEGSDMWTNPLNSTCRELTADGEAMIVLSSLRQ